MKKTRRAGYDPRAVDNVTSAMEEGSVLKVLHLLLSFVFHSGRQAKVCNLQLHVFVEQHVAKLQVSMDDALSVNVRQSID